MRQQALEEMKVLHRLDFAGPSLSGFAVSLAMKISQCFGSPNYQVTVNSSCSSLWKTCTLPTEQSLLVHTTCCSREGPTTGLYPWVGDSNGLLSGMPAPREQAYNTKAACCALLCR